MINKLKLAIPVILSVLFLDRLSKVLVSNLMYLYQSVDVIGSFFRLIYVVNPYAAFSLNLGNWWIMMGLNLVAIIFIIYYFVISDGRERFKLFALSMILGGALGNNYDRIFHREVVDFLEFGIGKARFAIFNVADMSVFFGVVFILFLTLRQQRDAKV